MCPRCDLIRDLTSVEPDVEAVAGEGCLTGGHHRTIHGILRVITDLPGTPPHPSTFGHAIAHLDRSWLPGYLQDVVAPLLRHLGIERDGAMRGDRRQVRPRAWHHVDELIAAATEGDPPAAAGLVGQVV